MTKEERRITQLTSKLAQLGPMPPGRYVGQYSEWDLSWAGTNAAGPVVPPGNYLLRLEVDTATRTFSRLCVVSVVY